MIVRIQTENQYRLDDEYMDDVRQLDDELDASVASNDSAGFHAALQKLIALVEKHGQTIPDDEIVPSDLIVPAPDMTLDEAQAQLHAMEAQQAPGQ
jgi:hypothetical protein